MGRFGRYEVEGELGAGGMGRVFRARDAALGRPVAIKVLAVADATYRERFAREAHALAALDHPGIVRVLDCGEERGSPWLALELIEGETLAARLRRGISPDEAARLLAEVARAVAHAHERGVVHRDLKPANIIIDREARARVVDFGVALLEGAGRLTRTGTIVGTVDYLSPEQASAEEASPASDVWAIGAILHEALSGRRPFAAGSAVETITRILYATPEPTGHRALDPVIRRALAKEPARRPTAAELAALLEARPRRRRLHPVALVPIAAVLAVAVLAGRRDREDELVAAGRRLLESDEPAAAVRVFTEALARDPGDLALLRLRARASKQAGQHAAALLDLDRAVRIAPSADLHRERAEARFRVADTPGALEDLERAVVLDPRDALAFRLRAAVRLSRNDVDGALADATRAIEIDPRLARAWSDRSTAKWSRRDAAGALADALEAARLDPRLYEAWANAAAAAHALEDLPRAEELARKAVEANPRSGTAWNALATIRLERGRHADAIEDLGRATQLDPRSVAAWFNLGAAHAATNERAKAREALRRCLDLAPDHGGARRLLAQIDSRP